jgi:bifunctional non-homologous end joining protein LigD
LLAQLEPLVSRRCALVNPPHKPRARWLEPILLANIVHRGGFGPNRVRHARFEGLVQTPQKERPAPLQAGGRRPAVPAENILQFLPDAVVPSPEELQSYWRRVASEALVHLGRRPLKLVRHFEGTTYYHKGPLPPVPRAVHQLRMRKRDGSIGVRLWVDDLAACSPRARG